MGKDLRSPIILYDLPALRLFASAVSLEAGLESSSSHDASAVVLF